MNAGTRLAVSDLGYAYSDLMRDMAQWEREDVLATGVQAARRIDALIRDAAALKDALRAELKAQALGDVA